MCLNEPYAQILFILKRGGRSQITWKKYPSATGHIDLKARRQKNLRCTAMVNWSQKCTILVLPQSQNSVVYYDEEKAQNCKIIDLKEVMLPSESVFFGHETVEHASCGWKGSDSLRHRLFLIPEGMGLRTEVVFAYEDAMQRMVWNRREVLLRNVDPLNVSDEEEGDDDNVSGNMNGV